MNFIEAVNALYALYIPKIRSDLEYILDTKLADLRDDQIRSLWDLYCELNPTGSKPATKDDR